MDRKRLYGRALDKWGLKFQALKLMEELAEVQNALTDYLLNPSQKTDDHLAEEIADAEIMLEQFDYITFTDVDKKRQQKLERLENMINQQGGQNHE